MSGAAACAAIRLLGHVKPVRMASPLTETPQTGRTSDGRRWNVRSSWPGVAFPDWAYWKSRWL